MVLKHTTQHILQCVVPKETLHCILRTQKHAHITMPSHR